MRELISRLISDVVAETSRRLRAAAPASADAVRALDQPIATFSASMVEIEGTIKAFLYRRMYRHQRVMGIMRDAEKIVADLFGHYLAHPHELPHAWLPADAAGDDIARSIGDFIAGMTDRFALSEHVRFLTRPRICVRRAYLARGAWRLTKDWFDGEKVQEKEGD